MGIETIGLIGFFCRNFLAKRDNALKLKAIGPQITKYILIALLNYPFTLDTEDTRKYKLKHSASVRAVTDVICHCKTKIDLHQEEGCALMQ